MPPCIPPLCTDERLAVAECEHHRAQRQKTARAREGVRVEVHGHVPEELSPTQCFELADDDSVPELSGLEEVRPQVGLGRHTGVGCELVLNPVVPQLGREPHEHFIDIPVRAGLKRLRDLHGGGLSRFSP